jgi:segregation and condensation protein B
MRNDEPNRTENQRSGQSQTPLPDDLFYEVPEGDEMSSQAPKTETSNQPVASQAETQPVFATKKQSITDIEPTADSQTQFSNDSKQQNVDQQKTSEPIIAEPPGLSEEEKKRRQMVLLEAALYVAGRPLDLNEICSAINTKSKKRGQQLVKELQKEYASRNGALEILELRDERYVLQLKAEFTPLVKKLVNRPLLSSGPLKTLSYIAYRQPISQKRVIEVRGQHAYGHIKILKDMNLITPERSGRSILLRTTDYFADYFGLAHDVAVMKRDLKRIFGDIPTKTAQQTDTHQQQKDEQQQ